MRKFLNRRRVIVVLLLLGVIAAGYVLVPLNAPDIKEACDRIRRGMTEDQVDSILRRRFAVFNSWPAHGPGAAQDWTTIWLDDEGNRIHIAFNSQRGVTDKGFSPSTMPFAQITRRRIERLIRTIRP